MQKLLFINIIFLISCSRVEFESPMPFKSEILTSNNFVIRGTYFYSDSNLKLKDRGIVYNSMYYPNIYKYYDSVETVSANLEITEKLVRIQINSKEYYLKRKFDSTQLFK